MAPSPSTKSSAPAGSPIAHVLLAGVIRTVLGFFRMAPASVAYGLAGLAAPPLAFLTRRSDRRKWDRGRGMERNLRIVFRQELTPARHRRLLRAWARHMAHLVVDFARMPRITAENVGSHCEFTAVNAYRGLVKERGGAIWASGHVGCWEMLGHGGALNDLPVSVLARPLDIAPLDALVTEIRTSGGQRVVEKWGGLWSVKKVLDTGDNVGILADEDVAKRPVFVPFLGTIASANPGLAQLHRVSRKPIIVVTCHRIGRERFRFRVWDVIDHAPTEDRDADQRAILTRVSAALSRSILAHPAQWLWGSRRFGTRPPGEVLDTEGLPPVVPGDRSAIARAARLLDRI